MDRDRCIRWWGAKHPKDNCEFVFEDGDKHKGHFVQAIEDAIQHDKRVLRGIRPKFKPKKLRALQAADFVVWEQRNLITDRLMGGWAVRETFLELEKTPSTWGYLDADKITKFCDQFGVVKR